MIKEFCAENFTQIQAAIKNGANRIELCDNLAVGGTTPSYGVIKRTVEYCKEEAVPVMTMIRPRGGNFNYSIQEGIIMENDIEQAIELGTDGVVLGCLTEDNRIDHVLMETLLKKCKQVEVTFHMAFDEISPDHQFEEMEWLIDHHATRILTHGKKSGKLIEHQDRLNELITHAKGRIEILPGGGITHENLEIVKQVIETDQFHGTRIVEQ
ncbi:copper homeostasis protein CutC [Marinilactibacillus kalidii]|uniref:copper homeostasis protein CutC n=1 Tax=Marinilactibacillus kalidii TaxID=2820274 RepID=UPI001ABE7286|nr:copper homeostasis protein CutC [Marinilactibacillus kalidii]